MNFENLNKMINYIEENLTEKIDYNELSKIVGEPKQILQRIFVFLTNMTITEYIRKRRLQNAFEDLKLEDVKILDLSLKYGYESDIAFTRAFKAMFGMTPSEVKKAKDEKYKLMPIIKFNKDFEKMEFNYKIKDIEEIELYCFETEATNYDDLLYKIRELYRFLKETGIHKKLKASKMYGISIERNEQLKYLVGSKEKMKNTIKYIIPKGKYAIFEVGSREQKDITKLENNIYLTWKESSKIELDYDFSFEYYEEENCFLYIPIKA